jgi:hypothetical protein
MKPVPDIMSDRDFEQMTAEAIHTLGKATVLKYLLPICGSRHPLEMNQAEREKFMLAVGVLVLEASGGIGHG